MQEGPTLVISAGWSSDPKSRHNPITIIGYHYGYQSPMVGNQPILILGESHFSIYFLAGYPIWSAGAFQRWSWGSWWWPVTAALRGFGWAIHKWGIPNMGVFCWEFLWKWVKTSWLPPLQKTFGDMNCDPMTGWFKEMWDTEKQEVGYYRNVTTTVVTSLRSTAVGTTGGYKVGRK